jgi:hypothetical protein
VYFYEKVTKVKADVIVGQGRGRETSLNHDFRR